MSVTTNEGKPDLGSLRIDEGKRHGGKTGKILGIGAAVLGLVVIVTGAVFALRGQTPVVEVATAQPVAAGRPTLLNASGYVTPRRRATVAAKITGRVVGVYFDEGMHVTEGFVLARWMIPTCGARLIPRRRTATRRKRRMRIFKCS